MRIILTAVEAALAEAWKQFCGDLDFVEVYKGSILEVNCDAVVSPANSYGFMDGGIDAVYLRYFGEEIELRIRRQIYDHHQGELLVGQADVVETENTKHPFLIAAPTMRVPMILRDSVNPYLATRAIFILVKHGVFRSGTYAGQPIAQHIKTIAIPGMGTGVGRVDFKTCALQVRAAMNDILLGEYRMPQTWAEASERHQLLYTKQLKRMQHDL